MMYIRHSVKANFTALCATNGERNTSNRLLDMPSNRLLDPPLTANKVRTLSAMCLITGLPRVNPVTA